MEAQTLNCPMCGASASTASTRCSHCNARLATISCPSCFGMMFQGAKYCSHCGALASRTELSAEGIGWCPRCKIEMRPVMVGKTRLCECARCEGLWVDTTALEKICADRDEQAVVLGAAAPVPTVLNAPLEKVRYVSCPVCKELMHRINFANCSNVVVDVCKPHGTWFDKDELRRIVEFIRAGGFEKSRAKQIAELERKKEELKAARDAAMETGSYDCGRTHSADSVLMPLSFAAVSILGSYLTRRPGK